MQESGSEPSGHPVTFGSASLLENDTDVVAARAVLEAALDAGAARLDVAPMYGHGLSEAMVLSLGAERGIPVTTKAGIEPRARPSRLRRVAAASLRRMPPSFASTARQVMGTATSDPFAASGRFAPDAIRASIERSLRLTGRIDRLLLHEVQPLDVTDELLDLLTRYQRSGEVTELGCATRNAITEAVLARSDGVLTVAHVSASPLGDPVPAVPPGTTLVGHGVLGPGGSDLRRLRTLLGDDHGRVSPGAATVSPDEDDLVRALIARAWTQDVDELLVATTRVGRAPALVKAAASVTPLPPQQSESLERAIARASARDHGRGGRRADRLPHR